MEAPDRKMTGTDLPPADNLFVRHLGELRWRLGTSLAAVVLAAAVIYPFRLAVSRFLCRPLVRAMPAFSGLVYTALHEAFVAYLKMSLVLGLLAASPVLVYNLWRFVSPGLFPHERRAAALAVIAGSGLFFAGAAFYYFVALPRMIAFFLWFEGGRFEPVLRLGGYLGFVARGALAFGIAFEVPFLVAAAVRTGVVSRDFFSSRRLSFYVGLGAVSFLLAAGDPAATLMILAPLALLQELGLLLAGPGRGRE
jgi:sec-independent protein translocase protein TatC